MYANFSYSRLLNNHGTQYGMQVHSVSKSIRFYQSLSELPKKCYDRFGEDICLREHPTLEKLKKNHGTCKNALAIVI